MEPVQIRFEAPIEPIVAIPEVEVESGDESGVNTDAVFAHAFTRSEELRQSYARTQQKRKNICLAVTGTVVAFLVGLAKYPAFRAWQDARIFGQIESLSADPATHDQAVSLLPKISAYSPALFNKSVEHVLGQNHANYTSIARSLLNLGEMRQQFLDQQITHYRLQQELKQFRTNIGKYLKSSSFEEALDEAAKMPLAESLEKQKAYETILNKLTTDIAFLSTHEHLKRAIDEVSKLTPKFDIDKYLSNQARLSKTPEVIIPFIADLERKAQTLTECIGKVNFLIDHNKKQNNPSLQNFITTLHARKARLIKLQSEL